MGVRCRFVGLRGRAVLLSVGDSFGCVRVLDGFA